MADQKRVPVTVLTGFLGSGKTTLLNHILKDQTHGLRFAIIENEFGEVGVDDKLINMPKKDAKDAGTLAQLDGKEELIEVMNGCICCTVRGDLVEALKRMHKRVKDFDAVLIETTGMADPAPVAQTFFVDEDIQKMYKLDGIVTVVDAKHIEQHLDKEVAEGAENESVEQLAFADRVILNKCDLLGVSAKFTSTDEAQEVPSNETMTIGNNAGGQDKDADQPMALNGPSVNASTEAALAKLESRIKAINTSAPIIRACYSKVDPKLLLNIGAFDINRVLEMEPGFLESDGTDHVHDDSVSSVAWSVPGLELNVNKLERFISVLIEEMSADLFRYKGILAVKGKKEQFVFQGIHMMFSGGFNGGAQVWKTDEERECRFVFIGKQVKQKYAERLKQGFLDCAAETELRFKVGDFVEACVTGGWKKCKILKVWDEGNPYRMEIQDGNKTNVWGPVDLPFIVRSLHGGEYGTDGTMKKQNVPERRSRVGGR